MEKINFPQELSPNMSSFSKNFSKKEKRKEKADFLSCSNQMRKGFLKRQKPKGKIVDPRP